jgi:DNA repair protein RadD
MSDQPAVREAPGFAFRRVLASAPARLIHELVGPELVEVLGLLDPQFSDDAKLRQLAEQMVDPRDTLRSPALLAKVVEALPLAKAKELAGRLGIDDHLDKQLFRRLDSAISRPEAETALLSFFGVVLDEGAIARAAATTIPVRATYSLFDHQRSAARRVKAALATNPNSVVLHMPTGAGKTRTAMHIVCEHLVRAGPTLVVWLAQSPELLDQAVDEYQKAWGALGNRDTSVVRMWGGHTPDLSEISDGLLVGGFAKLHALYQREPNRLLSIGDRTSLTVVDEAHQAIAPTYSKVIRAISTKRPGAGLLGLTATPGRTWNDVEEDAALAAFFGERKVTLDIPGYDDPVRYLIDEGYLASPRFRTLNYEPGPALRQSDVQALATDLDVPDWLLERLGDDAQRNLRIVTALEEMVSRHKRIIVFASSVRHAHLIAGVLIARGVEALVVTGAMDGRAREKNITRFRGAAATPIVMCNFGVLTTGFDAPRTSAAIIARPTRSLVLYSQMVGRATRGVRAGGNAEAEIVTVVDPALPGFGDIADAFVNWEDVWNDVSGGTPT